MLQELAIGLHNALDYQKPIHGNAMNDSISKNEATITIEGIYDVAFKTLNQGGFF